MSTLRPDFGTSIPGLVTLEGSFRVDGTSDPDDVRDGNTNAFTVARTSAGLFTITFKTRALGGPQLPEKLIFEVCSIQTAIAATVEIEAKIVLDSYSAVTRSFQIQCKKPTNSSTTTLLVIDPADNDRIGFFLRGSILRIGRD